LLAAILALVILRTDAAHAEKRVALVIGNAAYGNIAQLANPRNDANDIAASLARLNFSVNKVIDGTFDDVRRALLKWLSGGCSRSQSSSDALCSNRASATSGAHSSLQGDGDRRRPTRREVALPVIRKTHADGRR
jgi:hypothetical protein